MNLSGDAAHLSAKMGLHDFLQTGYVHLHDHRLAYKLNQYHNTAFTISHLAETFDDHTNPVSLGYCRFERHFVKVVDSSRA